MVQKTDPQSMDYPDKLSKINGLPRCTSSRLKCFKWVLQISSFSYQIFKKFTSYKETGGQNIFISQEMTEHIGRDERANDN